MCDYIEYKPTATSYTPSTLYDITGTINPSDATGWRVLSNNSDGTIDIIPANTGGTLEFGIDGYTVDNETYAYYEESLQAIANAFKNSTYASSARIPSESDFTTIRNNSLTILNKYPLTRKNSESRSWTGNQEGGANYYCYIYYANNTTTTQFIIWEKYAGTGGQSSTSHSIGLEIRPIVRIKADIYENGGNGSSSSPWKMTTL